MKYNELYDVLPNLSLRSSESIGNHKTNYDTVKTWHHSCITFFMISLWYKQYDSIIISQFNVR